ncbi:hypothetical protein B1812_04155 [Methylocystis bryophila]|uniref:Uncharacterized protein n=1 Tax=Methylocystis bryophila TaxID=655015 RepID=A0A1W6MS66_9HYPH|nr:hypothetical protein B1812_04155 [Methylocystis bryophila]
MRALRARDGYERGFLAKKLQFGVMAWALIQPMLNRYPLQRMRSSEETPRQTERRERIPIARVRRFLQRPAERGGTDV